jgi:type I restriction-modification system DNA methylase subunit
MRLVKRCRQPGETMKDLAVMLAAVVAALEAEPIDFIGPIYTAFAANTYAGQFFTPYSLSRTMAEMIIGDPSELLREKPFIMLSEPACGVGGMMLAANQVLRDHDVRIERQAHWVAVDVDARAIHGAYIQTTLTGASATIIHGNSLTLEQWLTAPTLMAVVFPKRAPARIDALPQPAKPPAPVNRRGQFSFVFE